MLSLKETYLKETYLKRNDKILNPEASGSRSSLWLCSQRSEHLDTFFNKKRN